MTPVLRKELIDKVAAEFPHLITIADNIQKSNSLQKQRLEKIFAQAASNLVCRDLEPTEILEISKAANFKI